jgi:hypothetical protein
MNVEFVISVPGDVPGSCMSIRNIVPVVHGGIHIVPVSITIRCKCSGSDRAKMMEDWAAVLQQFGPTIMARNKVRSPSLSSLYLDTKPQISLGNLCNEEIVLIVIQPNSLTSSCLLSLVSPALLPHQRGVALWHRSARYLEDGRLACACKAIAT